MRNQYYAKTGARRGLGLCSSGRIARALLPDAILTKIGASFYSEFRRRRYAAFKISLNTAHKAKEMLHKL